MAGRYLTCSSTVLGNYYITLEDTVSSMYVEGGALKQLQFLGFKLEL